MPTVDVVAMPDQIHGPTGPIAVVVDVLRATTMIAALLDAGVSGILPVATVEQAREAAGSRPGYLLAGEREGIPPEGFAMGNSPVRIDPGLVRGRLIVLTTTNGTRAITLSRDAEHCLMLALTNLDRVAERLWALDQDTLIVCSGTDGGRSDEDELAAGLLADRLQGWTLTDRAEEVRDRATGSIGACGGIDHAVARSWHARRLTELGFGDDVAFCSRLSVTRTVPRLDRASGLITAD
ncbi:MAG: 2-phosphosulfolactate phosphatase [Phycisphaerales bacterium]|nr:2-phosphosulfolactate phosphatase [Planctomycetota bacterium]MCH8507711.1 2-phosphosulfolactate phosphatase [Phycisphaerales bacterium]